MSVKDPDAFDRKVRPIYDALDARNWKGALKLCQQALVKYPDHQLLKVLRAIGLDRSGKKEESLQVVEEVLARRPPPTDEQVLRLAAMVLRAAGRLSAITAAYEAASAAVPHDLGLLQEVFGGHVRESNFVKQQQVALKLSKQAAAIPRGPEGGEHYGWWVVLSILLQARAALRARASGMPAPAGQVPAVALEPEKLMALAEGMVSRQAAKEGKLEGYEALMVYVDVLLAQGKVAEALAAVAGPLGAAALRLPSERLQLRAVLSALSGDLGAASELLREGLRLNPDDWGALLLLLDCMLPPAPAQGSGASAGTQSRPLFVPEHPLVCISGGLAEQLPPKGVDAMAAVAPDGDTAAAFARAEAAVQELVDLCKEKEAGAQLTGGEAENGGGQAAAAMIMRGPDLASVELAMRRHKAAAPAASDAANGSATGSSESCSSTEAVVVDRILSYYKKYGSMVSCAVDLRTYVGQLSEAAAERLLAGLRQQEDELVAASADAKDGGSGAWTEANTNRAKLRALRRRVCAAQIRDDLGRPTLTSCHMAVQSAVQLLDLYGTARPLQEGLDERERGAADELPCLAAASLVTAAVLSLTDTAAVPYLLAAYGILSDAVSIRPFGAGMRIALSAIASLLAAPAAAHAHLTKLDIKNIQLDSLGGHLLLPPLIAWPNPPSLGATATGSASAAAGGASAGPSSSAVSGPGQDALLQAALKATNALFDDHAKDAGETLNTAYIHGMYTKVLEFTAFRERLAASHTRAVARAEAAIAAVRAAAGAGAGEGQGQAAADALRTTAIDAAKGLPVEELPTTGSCRYNWDLAVRPTWLPPGTGGPAAEPLEWWRCRGQGAVRGHGYGRCWWSATSAAEARGEPAASWRQQQAAAAAHRWLLPHAAAGAFAPGDVQTGVLGLKDAVEHMRALLPGDAGDQAPGLACPLQLRRLDVQLYDTARAVQEGLAASDPATVLAAVNDACAATEGLAEAMASTLASATRELQQQAQEGAGLGATGGALPGSALAVVSHLLREPLTLLTACMQNWHATVKGGKKKKGKAQAAAAPGDEGAAQHQARLGAVLAAACARLAEAVRACAAELEAAGKGAPDMEVVLVGLKELGLPELGAAGRSGLAGLLKEQRATVAQLGKQAGAVAKALAALA